MARNSIYPPSVTPGIPNLGEKPTGWNYVKFGDVLTPIYRKVNLDDNLQYKLVVAKRNRGGIVKRSVLLGKQIKTKSQFKLRHNDFLIAKRQIVHGACGVVPKQLDGSIVSNEYSVLNVNDGLLLDYLNYYSHTIHFQQTCFQSSIGVDVEKMVFKLDEWLDWKFYLPPLDEQRKIAEILTTWDEAIRTTEKIIAALEKRKKGLMQRLLTGQVRFPGFTDEWNEMSLGEVAEVIMGQSPESTFYNEEKLGLPLIQGNADITDRKTNPRIFTSQITKECFPGDIILSVRAPVGETAISTINGCIGRGVCSIRIKKGNQKYLYYVLLANEYKWGRFAQGSTFTAINSSDIKKLPIYFPISDKEQIKIVDILNDSDLAIYQEKKKLFQLKQQKQGLMQRLLTGQVRVSV